MFKRDDVLMNPQDFENAILFAIPIEVFLKDGSHQETGIIESHTDGAIKMTGGNNYLKCNCIIKVGIEPNQTLR